MDVILIEANVKSAPIGAVVVAEFVKNCVNVKFEWGKVTSLRLHDGTSFTTTATIARYLSRVAPSVALYGRTLLEVAEVNHWLTFSVSPLSCERKAEEALDYLDGVLERVNFLVGTTVTLADILVWAALYTSPHWQSVLASASKGSANVMRWYSFLSELPEFRSAEAKIPQEVKVALYKPTPDSKGQETSKPARKEEGKFVELPGAKMNEVVVRFPPEASGFLHIGHAKAALLNQYYQLSFKGQLILRFDDTNPAKETEEFEQVILEDVKLLEIVPDRFTRTSDHFDLLLTYCEQMLRDGTAYCDDTDPEAMKQEREQKKDSRNRKNNVEQNLKMWEEMKKGTAYGHRCCVRAKIDMQSLNGCMRDPTIYRCKAEPHLRTGDNYKVYPTYDFACPIVDSVEGVTHALRTMEYHDRDDQYYWFIDRLGLRKPYIWEYSRLNMTNTVLSKRKLTWFVNEGLVDGWDDPRFPTVRGVLRRGMTVEGLKQFIIAQGSSRSVVTMEWDKIWAFNKKVIDPIAPRFTALEKQGLVPVRVSGVSEKKIHVNKHPKNESIGFKNLRLSPDILIDGADAETLKEGENVTFINWGNLLIRTIVRDKNNKIERVEAAENLENRDFKKTLKLTWLANETESVAPVPCVCVYFEHIIGKAVMDRDDDFKKYIGHSTKTEVAMIGDPELKELKKSDIIQLQRRGFFICDSPYEPISPYTSCESPVILFHIPDGHSKELPTLGLTKRETSPKESIQSARGKSAEKSPLEHKQPPAIADSVQELDARIRAQGDQVRQLKADKATKEVITTAVQLLLSLKKQFKEASGQDWTPDIRVEKSPPAAPTASSPIIPSGVEAIVESIRDQGDRVRQLKADKAAKDVVTAAVQQLLELKKQYKAVSGKDWVPGAATAPSSQPATKPVGDNQSPPIAGVSAAAEEIDKQIAAQGDLVRQLKAQKATKEAISEKVKVLLELKSKYKSVSGKDWQPPSSTPQQPADNKGQKTKENLRTAAASSGITMTSTVTAGASAGEEIKAKIDAQGEKVRQLKAAKADAATITAEVQVLLALKAQYKEATGEDVPAGGAQKSSGGKKGAGKAEAKKATAAPPKKEETEGDGAAGGGPKKQTRLGLEALKEENLSDWYTQVITKSEMIEYYEVSGCYILRPWAFSIWEFITAFFDSEIKKMGVQNCYFPIFVSQSALMKEKSHIADFAPEVAWVTRSGDTELAEPIAIRPTSETVMYPSYAKWIKSHRDLPLKLNQWCSVVRWEFKHPQPFLRTREFLWQEGHSAFANRSEAEEEVYAILTLYRRVYEEYLAIPVIEGRKTEKEKFAGGDFTTTVEAYVSASGRGLQGATSHHLGQNFSRMFEIVFDHPVTGDKEYAHQNSWGLSTRTIGAMVMVHSDNTGLVLPPRVAFYQVVIIPCGITAATTEADRDVLIDRCRQYESLLISAGIRCKGDYRDNYSPGWKYNHWELKGVPIRMEVGPRDVKQGQFVAVRRDTAEKLTFPEKEVLDRIKGMLDNIQDSLFARAKKDLDSHMTVAHDWNEFTAMLERKCIIQSPFCGEPTCEDAIKKDSAKDEASGIQGPSMGAKSLCIPFKQPGEIKEGMHCINASCKNKPQFYTLFGRSY